MALLWAGLLFLVKLFACAPLRVVCNRLATALGDDRVLLNMKDCSPVIDPQAAHAKVGQCCLHILSSSLLKTMLIVTSQRCHQILSDHDLSPYARSNGRIQLPDSVIPSRAEGDTILFCALCDAALQYRNRNAKTPQK